MICKMKTIITTYLNHLLQNYFAFENKNTLTYISVKYSVKNRVVTVTKFPDSHFCQYYK